jgi:hypothetical protein
MTPRSQDSAALEGPAPAIPVSSRMMLHHHAVLPGGWGTAFAHSLGYRKHDVSLCPESTVPHESPSKGGLTLQDDARVTLPVPDCGSMACSGPRLVVGRWNPMRSTADRTRRIISMGRCGPRRSSGEVWRRSTTNTACFTHVDSPPPLGSAPEVCSRHAISGHVIQNALRQKILQPSAPRAQRLPRQIKQPFRGPLPAGARSPEPDLCPVREFLSARASRAVWSCPVVHPAASDGLPSPAVLPSVLMIVMSLQKYRPPGVPGRRAVLETCPPAAKVLLGDAPRF